MAKRLSKLTIDGYKRNMIKFRDECIMTIDEIKEYVQNNYPNEIEDFTKDYNTWFKDINVAYHIASLVIEHISKIKLYPSDDYRLYRFELYTGKKDIVEVDDTDDSGIQIFTAEANYYSHKCNKTISFYEDDIDIEYENIWFD